MRSEGKVISIDGKYAVVATERRAACEGCHKRSEDGTCSVCTLLGGESRLDTRALNSAGAAVGDTVALESSSGRMLGYAALVFILPCLLAIAAYFCFFARYGERALPQPFRRRGICSRPCICGDLFALLRPRPCRCNGDGDNRTRE